MLLPFGALNLRFNFLFICFVICRICKKNLKWKTAILNFCSSKFEFKKAVKFFSIRLGFLNGNQSNQHFSVEKFHNFQ
jgi:hypothetical protein